MFKIHVWRDLQLSQDCSCFLLSRLRWQSRFTRIYASESLNIMVDKSASASATWHTIPSTALSHLGLDYLDSFLIHRAIRKALIIPRFSGIFFLYPCLPTEGFVQFCCYWGSIYRQKGTRSAMATPYRLKWSRGRKITTRSYTHVHYKSELFERLRWYLLRGETSETRYDLSSRVKRDGFPSLEHESARFNSERSYFSNTRWCQMSTEANRNVVWIILQAGA